MSFAGSAQSMPDRGIVSELTWVYLDALYATGNKKEKEEANGVGSRKKER